MKCSLSQEVNSSHSTDDHRTNNSRSTTYRTRRLVSKSVTVQDPQGQDGAIGSDSEGDTIDDDIEHDRVEE